MWAHNVGIILWVRSCLVVGGSGGSGSTRVMMSSLHHLVVADAKTHFLVYVVGPIPVVEYSSTWNVCTFNPRTDLLLCSGKRMTKLLQNAIISA